MPTPDEELIFEYQRGNREAFEMIFERYKKPILNYCWRILGNRADAEDATGDVFTSVLSQKDSFKPQAKFSTWLFTIAHNACISKLRKRKPVFSLWVKKDDHEEMEEWAIPDPKPLPHAELLEKERMEAVKKAILKLPEAQKEALVLREYQELSYEEISSILGCSKENVKILIFRARERLRMELLSFFKEDRHGS